MGIPSEGFALRISIRIVKLYLEIARLEVKMAYCSSCNNVVHRTTKICPNCGGDFSKLFGPSALWGKPPGPREDHLASARQKVHQEYLDRKARGQTNEISQKPPEEGWIEGIIMSILAYAIVAVFAVPIIWIIWMLAKWFYWS